MPRSPGRIRKRSSRIRNGVIRAGGCPLRQLPRCLGATPRECAFPLGMEAADSGRERGEREQAESLASETGPLVRGAVAQAALDALLRCCLPVSGIEADDVHGRDPGQYVAIAAGRALRILTGSGLLLIAGLGTPLTGTLVAVIEIWRILTMDEDPLVCLLAGTIGGALAMLGPGRWSVDAQLFGWKRIEAPPRRSSSNVP
jgi:hypothetical protein